jgi:hypothetical protein
MKINIFGSGKPEKKVKPIKSSVASAQISDLEKQLGGWTNTLKQTEQRLKNLSDKVEPAKNADGTNEKAKAVKLEVEPVRPHGPIGELSLESDNSLTDEIQPDELEDTEVAKMIEATPETDSPVGEVKGDKTGGLSDSFKELFASDDEDDNPLASLVKSLPDVTVNELEDDLNEIKDIIKDWQKK